MRTRLTAATVLLLVALTGCSSSGTAEPAAEPSSSPAAVSTTPTPPSAPQVALKMGTTWEWDSPSDGVSGTVTVLDYKQGFTSHVDPKDAGGGDEWAYIELKTCSTRGTFFATAGPWTLAYADSSRVKPAGFHPVDFPRPEYVDGTKLTDGKCLRGKLGFTVPAGLRPDTVVYAPESVDLPQEWAVPAKG